MHKLLDENLVILYATTADFYFWHFQFLQMLAYEECSRVKYAITEKMTNFYSICEWFITMTQTVDNACAKDQARHFFTVKNIKNQLKI